MTQVFDFRRKLGEDHVWADRSPWSAWREEGGAWEIRRMRRCLSIDLACYVRTARHIVAYQANPGMANEHVRQDRDWARFFGMEYHSPATAESEEG